MPAHIKMNQRAPPEGKWEMSMGVLDFADWQLLYLQGCLDSRGLQNGPDFFPNSTDQFCGWVGFLRFREEQRAWHAPPPPPAPAGPS